MCSQTVKGQDYNHKLLQWGGPQLTPSNSGFSCGQIDAQPNCHQQGIIQQLMTADSEAHSQTLSVIQQSCSRGERSAGARGIKDMLGRFTQSPDLGS